MGFLRHRRREPEWMDEPGADPIELQTSLVFIRRVNRLLRYTRATLHHLEAFSRGWRAGQQVRILDVATGSADIPVAILEWARWRKFDLTIVGIDLHEATTHIARRSSSDPRLHIVRADATALPFADGSFDYALTAMFLHHLDDDVAITVLREMNRVARRGVIAADLLRHYRAYGWINVLTLFSNPMVRHDARVSVRQAFSKPEVLELREAAGLRYTRYHRHFGHRFVLAGEKPIDPGGGSAG